MTADMPRRMDSINSTITAGDEEHPPEQQQPTPEVAESHSDEAPQPTEQSRREEEMTPRISNSQSLIEVADSDIVQTLSAVEESLSQVGLGESEPVGIAPSVDPLTIDPTNTPSRIGASKSECSNANPPINKLMVKPIPAKADTP